MDWNLKLHVIKTSYWKYNKFSVPISFILKYFYSSLNVFENKVVNKGKTDLTNATHNLYALLTAIFQEW